jgi:hypothetical protein
LAIARAAAVLSPEESVVLIPISCLKMSRASWFRAYEGREQKQDGQQWLGGHLQL